MSAQIIDKIDWRNFEPGPVVGLDEVGRGCLAGPVYASAVVFRQGSPIPVGLTDSKVISEKKREKLAAEILEFHWVGIGLASPNEIDEINILQASFLAMRRAVVDLENKMGKPSGHLLVDGHMKIPKILVPQTAIVKGDLLCEVISAAAIVAKVTRDRVMKELDQNFPVYGFASHKGYPSASHKKAIAEAGPSPWHRRSFSGVKEYL